jgi:CMP-N,N'-diacetyllegionaminic acid synthase
VVTPLNPVVAVILARGGSKGIPRKNVMQFHGRPLIAWSILQSLKAGITDIYVSTDDSEIAGVASAYGATVIERPAELSGDDASGDEGTIHSINKLELTDNAIVVMPQVTSPLRLATDIVNVLGLVVNGDFDSAFTANRIDDICVWSLGDSPRSVTYDFESRVMRQDRPPMVVENGSIYCTRAGALRQSGNRLSGRIGVSLMPKWTMPEIDDPEDIKLCEVLMDAYADNLYEYDSVSRDFKPHPDRANIME